MSLYLRVHKSQVSRSLLNEHSKPLLHFSEPPLPNTTKPATCDAYDTEGNRCTQNLSSKDYGWCRQHFEDLKKLKAQWARSCKDAEKVEVTSQETATQKVTKLQSAVALRRRVHSRYYSHGGDLVEFLNWTVKLEDDIKHLAESIHITKFSDTSKEDTLGGPVTLQLNHPNEAIMEDIPIINCADEPKVATSSLYRRMTYGTINVLKIFYADLCRERIRHLYAIVPYLNDGVTVPTTGTKNEWLDVGVSIIRTWFRVMVLNNSDADALEAVARAKSIDEYLHSCHLSQLEMYCDFFETAWRPHALHYLRVAICAQTLAGRDVSSICILGGIIPRTTDGFKMSKSTWDILYRWLPDLVTPWTLTFICADFDDYATICKLLMLGVYQEHWDYLFGRIEECRTGVFLGFTLLNKGNIASLTGMKQDGDMFVQTESRNYICGQMAIGDPLAEELIIELRRRTERLFLVVYKGTNVDATVHPSDEELFISRHRSAKVQEDVETEPWKFDVTIEDVKNDLRPQKTSMYDPVMADSWQFILIDREADQPFQLFDVVQDALLMLAGDPTPKQIAKRVIQDIFPSPVQEIFFEQMTIDGSVDLRFPSPPAVQYEGNRQRCYHPDRQVILAHQLRTTSDVRSRDENRFIRQVVDDLERRGIISIADEYEQPQTRPLIIQGTDGGLDLYFPYEVDGLAPKQFTASFGLPRKSCLADFAKSFKERHPSAIMAKGSIMTHYCAWPMPAIKRLRKERLNFGTWEGHVYQWNAMPFDRPWSENAWQYYIQHYINSKYTFVMFYLTTFVICATDNEDAERAASTLLEETEKREWRIILPSLRDWTDQIDDLKLEDIFNGVQPV